MKLYLLIIANISLNVDHFPYCGFSNARTHEEVIWTYLSFHPLGYPFDVSRELQSNATVKSGLLIGMLFPHNDVNHFSKASLTVSYTQTFTLYRISHFSLMYGTSWQVTFSNNIFSGLTSFKFLQSMYFF